MPTEKEFLAKKAELDLKQDRLTAGDNITINPNTNVISATDTTYSDVTGATSQTAGVHGLVPAPAAGDESKFLKGDGTWDTVSAGSASLAGLTDVDLHNLTDGQALVYDATNQEWVNGEVSGTDVEANPQGTPTDDLDTIGINGTIYNIAGSGGGGNVYGAFIDTNRLIKSTTAIPANTDVTYTATEDCAVIFTLLNAQNQNYAAWIDGISFCSSWGQTGAKSGQQMVYLKKGQTIKFNQTYTGADGGYEVYGLSYGTQNIFAPQIYSLTEREVGTWINNKPLYCKTIEISQYNVTLKNDVWTNICAISDADYMVKAVVNTQSPNTAYLMRFQIDNGYLQGASNIQVTLTQYGQLYVTLYYTKSTDVPGSGQYNTLGIPMEHDSTTEHVVGTDENGETIYEITIKVPTMSWTTGSGYAMYQVDTSCITDNVKRVWWVKGMLHDNNDNRDLPIPYFRIVDSESIYYQLMQLPDGSVSLGIFIRSSNAGGYIPSDLSATIRYTKI